MNNACFHNISNNITHFKTTYCSLNEEAIITIANRCYNLIKINIGITKSKGITNNSMYALSNNCKNLEKIKFSGKIFRTEFKLTLYIGLILVDDSGILSFTNCKKLKSITLVETYIDNLSTIDELFNQCTDLQMIHIPRNDCFNRSTWSKVRSTTISLGKDSSSGTENFKKFPV